MNGIWNEASGEVDGAGGGVRDNQGLEKLVVDIEGCVLWDARLSESLAEADHLHSLLEYS